MMLPGAFRKVVWAHYHEHGRHSLLWRKTRDPYRILVSEVMLQQTQVDRVIPKYQSFLKKFPTFKALAEASLQSVLVEWKGLGYNRRALGLKRAAEAVVKEYAGKLPKDYASLLKLPSIGPYTAHALRTFVWNESEVLIETNIRSVYIHHFFPRTKKVDDVKLLPFIEKTLDTKKPREWYYALMDYGSHLKKTVGNASKKSASYTKQSKFKGSHRELRAQILHEIAGGKGKTSSRSMLIKKTGRKPSDIDEAVKELMKEGFIIVKGKRLSVGV